MSTTCDCCGARAAGDRPPLTWVASFEHGRTIYCCADCTRQRLRAMEARLDSEHW